MKQSHSKLLEQFKHRAVRDLAWVIVSPPMVSGYIDDVNWWSNNDCLAEFNDCVSELKKLDQQPEPLLDHLANLKNKKLGSVFEGLVSFWLNISPNYQEKRQNIQIIEDNHTYGEIDFIIEEISTGKIIHLEVAVKFYLGCEPYADTYRWFGTTTFDQLGKKIDHLKAHQTQLTKKHPEQLKKYFAGTIDQRHCYVKGRLFYPENSDTSPQISSHGLKLADSHLRGRWSYVRDHNLTNTMIKINKSHWLAELSYEDTKEFDFASAESIAAINRAECYVETEGDADDLSEAQRIFYLPKTFAFPELE